MTLNDYCLSGTEISDSFFTALEITIGAESSDTCRGSSETHRRQNKILRHEEIPENAAKFILEVTGVTTN
jgi:hypothetical protein